jgi:hypothetical protein
VRPPRPVSVGECLAWLVLQTLLLMPMVLGQGVVELLSASPLGVVLLQGVLAVLIGSLMVRNLVLLWRAPAHGASKGTATPMLAVGVLFMVMSSGPLLEGQRVSTKPMGVGVLFVGLTLVFLGVRDVLRVRARRSAEPAG